MCSRSAIEKHRSRFGGSKIRNRTRCSHGADCRQCFPRSSKQPQPESPRQGFGRRCPEFSDRSSMIHELTCQPAAPHSMPYGSPWFGAGTYVAPPSFPIMSKTGIVAARTPAACFVVGTGKDGCRCSPAAAACLARWRSVLDSALRPKLVVASRVLQRAFLPDVAYVHLAVIAYAGDDIDIP